MAIIKRRRRWYASLDVPEDVQKKLGRKRFIKTLDTEQISVANRRAPLVISQWKAQIEQARGNGDDDITFFRRALEAAVKPEERDKLEEVIEQVWADKGAPVYAHGPGVEPAEDGRAEAAQERADAWLAQVEAVRFADHLDAWAEQSDLAPKTLHIARTKLARFVKAFPTVEDCTRKAAQAYVNKLSETLSNGSIRNDLGFIRSLWRYLVKQELAEGEPFDKLELPRQRRNGNKRKPFTLPEIRMLIDRSVEGPLHELIFLASHTGCRIEELCSLTVKDTDGDLIHIRQGKSDAAIRTIPVHPTIKDLVTRLRANSTDGYLFSGQGTDKFDHRSSGLRSKFGRLKTRLGFGLEHNFHSIRRFVSTCLHEAGIPEPVAADILGHEIRTLSYGLYAGAASNQVKREALERAIRILE